MHKIKCMTYNRWYFEFIRYSLGIEELSKPNVSNKDWNRLYRFAQEQAIVGVLFDGLKRIGEEGEKPPFGLLMEWIAAAEQISTQNQLLNQQCIDVFRELREAGFDCCLLKGQGNATMYPNPYSRMPGDIDLWGWPQLRIDNGQLTMDSQSRRAEIIKYVRANHPEKIELRYYHVGYQDKGIEVELHFMPNIMNNPVYHRRLQKWYIERQSEQCQNMVELPEGVGRIPIPTWEFNVVFQMAHMMHHFFDEGIGLRQMMDYFYLLQHAKDELTIDNGEWRITLKHLGLWKFAGAVMYVMREVFALEEKYMIAPVDEQRGKTLMAEILKGGNFGRYSGLTKHSAGGKYFAKIWRNMHLVREYPAEALCEPIFRTWHFFWRLMNK